MAISSCGINYCIFITLSGSLIKFLWKLGNCVWSIRWLREDCRNKFAVLPLKFHYALHFSAPSWSLLPNIVDNVDWNVSGRYAFFDVPKNSYSKRKFNNEDRNQVTFIFGKIFEKLIRGLSIILNRFAHVVLVSLLKNGGKKYYVYVWILC